MKMESVAEAQQGVESAVTETENQQITPAQIATLAQVTDDDNTITTAGSQCKLCQAQALQVWLCFF